MKNREIILNWLKRARSNLERAGVYGVRLHNFTK